MAINTKFALIILHLIQPAVGLGCEKPPAFLTIIRTFLQRSIWQPLSGLIVFNQNLKPKHS